MLILDNKFQEAINDIEKGLKLVPNTMLSELGHNEIELYFILYKIFCYYEIGDFDGIQQMVEILECQYPK